jgi:hypothetical protein
MTQYDLIAAGRKLYIHPWMMSAPLSEVARTVEQMKNMIRLLR